MIISINVESKILEFQTYPTDILEIYTVVTCMCYHNLLPDPMKK